MDIHRILSELKAERTRLDDAIAALERISPDGLAPRRVGGLRKSRKGRGRLTPEGRKRLSDLMKKRWAERRKKSKST